MDPYARGAIVGLRRETTAENVALAALQSIACQSYEVLDHMQKAAGLTLGSLKGDGGASVNSRLMQFQADILNVNVVRPRATETTALGAACLAGLVVGYWHDSDDVAKN